STRPPRPTLFPCTTLFRSRRKYLMTQPHIVIIGGGAGGLELATRLGNKLGRKGKARITLIDRNHTHIWKPLLHEVATGTLDVEIDRKSTRLNSSHVKISYA